MEKTQEHRKRDLWLKAGGGVLLVVAVCVAIAAEYILHHAEPLLHESVVETLSARFHSPVTLDHLGISLARGIEVRGTGLRILYLAGPTQPGLAQIHGQPATPMLQVQQFVFRITWHDLRTLNLRIANMSVQGVELHIPPHSQDGMFAADPQRAPRQPHFRLMVGAIDCRDVELFLEPSKPGKDAIEFHIRKVELTDVDMDGRMQYTEDLVIPRPKGEVLSSGHLGPWRGDDPRATPIDGHYSYQNADLSTIKGIGGTLSSTGDFSGQLGQLEIQGTTTTPNFSLDVSNHPVPLWTHFHAFVDGTTGDTTLTNVQAKLLHSDFTTAGAIVRIHDPNGHSEGHDIALNVSMQHGRIEDMLQLGMKTEPPVMRGGLAMKAKVHIPPGEVRVAQKLQLAGEVRIDHVEFSNAKLQDRIDALSMRAQGKPQEVKLAGSDRRPEIASQMNMDFTLANAMMLVPSLDYQMPGAKVLMTGAYSLDGSVFEFKGHVRTDATASQMLTGWKSTMVRPFDGLLKKHGAGVELPIAVSGVKGDVKFGLAMRGADESTQDMAADVKAKRQAHAPTPR